MLPLILEQSWQGMTGQSNKWFESGKVKLRIVRLAMEIVLSLVAFLVFLYLSVIHTLGSELVKAFILYNLTMASVFWMAVRIEHLCEIREMQGL